MRQVCSLNLLESCRVAACRVVSSKEVGAGRGFVAAKTAGGMAWSEAGERLVVVRYMAA